MENALIFLSTSLCNMLLKYEPEVLIGLETKVSSNPQVYEKVTELFQPLKMNLKLTGNLLSCNQPLVLNLGT